MGKLAVLMTGELRTFWFCAESLKNNLLIPNDTDVFLYATPIATGRASHPHNTTNKLYSESGGSYTSRHDELFIDIDEEALIRSVFGDRLKSLVISNDRTRAKALLQRKTEAFKAKKQSMEFIGNYNGPQYFVVEQYLHVQNALNAMREYEETNGCKYDYVLRIRPDTFMELPFHIDRLPLTSYDLFFKNQPTPENRYYMRENVFFGKRESVASVIDAYVEGYGESIYPFDHDPMALKDGHNSNYTVEFVWGYLLYTLRDKLKVCYFEDLVDWGVRTLSVPRSSIQQKYNIKKVETFYFITRWQTICKREQLVSAWYGTPDANVNVKELLQAMNSGVRQVTNHLFNGDPSPGYEKELTFTLEDGTVTKVQEGDSFYVL